MELPVLRSSRLLITVLGEADAPAVLDYAKRNDAHHQRWSPPRPVDWETLDNAVRRLRQHRLDFDAGVSVRLWLRLLDAPFGPLIGAVNYTNFSMGAFRRCIVGYHLDEAHVGHGYMTEALARSIRYIFDERQMHRIEANYMPKNERSARVLKGLGFNVEGYARDYLFIDGRFEDHILASLTNHDLKDVLELCTPPPGS